MFIRNLYSGGAGGYVTLAAIILSFIMLMCPVDTIRGQIPDRQALEEFGHRLIQRDNIRVHMRDSVANALRIPVLDTANGRFLFQVVNGWLDYEKIFNAHSARVIHSDRLYPDGSKGLSLTGEGLIVGVWDMGGVDTSHIEFGDRIKQMDGAPVLVDHPTHVTGTVSAAGEDSLAKGMAPAARIHAYDWQLYLITLYNEAANGLLISTHSYGKQTGWEFLNQAWTWTGDTTICDTVDYRFGYYNDKANLFDSLAYYLPYFLIVQAAGNNRGDGPTPLQPGDPQHDGGTTGYDCMIPEGVAKNILTIGGIDEDDGVISSYLRSGWGPADDGRVKPDLVAQAVSVYSTIPGDRYGVQDGTSQAAPAVSGSLALLQEYAMLRRNGWPLRSSALKALVLHSAEDIGQTGPDYRFGWGLMNTERAVEVLLGELDTHICDSLLLSDGDTIRFDVFRGEGNPCLPLKVTICWTDPPATPLDTSQGILNNNLPRLINDVDLTVLDPNNQIKYPWTLSGLTAPDSDAVRMERNDVDNVEQVLIDDPEPGTYTILITHTGALSGGEQIVSIVITGNDQPHLLSDTCNALSLNSQRKIDIADGGNPVYHQAVYASGGEVWYIESTDDGDTWSQERLVSSGKGTAAHPSIYSIWDRAYATWMENRRIRMARIIPGVPDDTCCTGCSEYEHEIDTADFNAVNPPTVDAAPVIAATIHASSYDGKPYVLVVYETLMEQEARLAYLWFKDLTLLYEGIIDTAGYYDTPVYPSLAHDRLKYVVSDSAEFHLAWKENDKIVYTKLKVASSEPLSLLYPQFIELVQQRDEISAPSIAPYWDYSTAGNPQDAVIAYSFQSDAKNYIEIVVKDSLGLSMYPDSKEVAVAEVNSPQVMAFCRYERGQNYDFDNIRCVYNVVDQYGTKEVGIIKGDYGQLSEPSIQLGAAYEPALVAFPPPDRELELYLREYAAQEGWHEITCTTDSLAKRAGRHTEPIAVCNEVVLEQNYPNPFNPSTKIRYSTSQDSRVVLTVHDRLGRAVATLVDREQAAGSYTAAFDALHLPPGVYLCRLCAGSVSVSKIMTLLR